MVPAHDQLLTLHIRQHVEAHEPREQDPHYRLFEQLKARLKRQGLWRCVIADELCGGVPELHHSYVEFSEITSVDPDKIAQSLGLHFLTDEDFQRWVESPGNTEVLCTHHHRAGYGIHQLPEPLWQAVRFHREGLPSPALFIPARDLSAPGEPEPDCPGAP